PPGDRPHQPPSPARRPRVLRRSPPTGSPSPQQGALMPRTIVIAAHLPDIDDLGDAEEVASAACLALEANGAAIQVSIAVEGIHNSAAAAEIAWHYLLY